MAVFGVLGVKEVVRANDEIRTPLAGEASASTPPMGTSRGDKLLVTHVNFTRPQVNEHSYSYWHYLVHG